MISPILIADPSVSVSGALRKWVERSGFKVTVVHFLDEAVEQVRTGKVEVLFTAASHTFDGETLCKKAKELVPQCAVVLIYPPEEDDPEPHAQEAGADSFLVGPLKRGTVIACLRSMLRMRNLTDTVGRLEADIQKHRDAPPPPPPAPAAPAPARTVDDVAFFKRLLLMEVKRSRRYRLPVSLLLVALDGFKAQISRGAVPDKGAVMAEAFQVLTGGLREIDVAVPASDDRFLVFLPHTAREGAITVAERLRTRISKIQEPVPLTASIGVACFQGSNQDAEKEVSFSSMTRQATEALRKAQHAGGDRIEVFGPKTKRDRILIG